MGLVTDPHRGAALYAVLLGALPLGFGSFETIWLFAGVFYALFMLVTGRLSPQQDTALLVVGGISVLYFVSTWVSPLFFPDFWGGLKDVGTYLQFLTLPVLILAMAGTLKVDVLKLFLWGIRVGAIFGFLIAFVQMIILGYDRAKGVWPIPFPFQTSPCSHPGYRLLACPG